MYAILSIPYSKIENTVKSEKYVKATFSLFEQIRHGVSSNVV